MFIGRRRGLERHLLIFFLVSLSRSLGKAEDFLDGHNAEALQKLSQYLTSLRNHDVVILLDVANSSYNDIELLRTTCSMAIRCFPFLSPSGNNITMMTFGERVLKEIVMENCSSQECMQAAVMELKHAGTKRATGDALRHARRYLKDDPTRGRAIALLTFGKWNFGRDPVSQAKRIVQSGYDLIVVGLGLGAFNARADLEKLVNLQGKSKGQELSFFHDKAAAVYTFLQFSIMFSC